MAHVRDVAAFDDSNIYLEPPRLWYPARECLGALLASAPASQGGNSTRALEVFQKDLEQYVDSAWSLYGAAKAANALGMTAAAKNYTTRGDLAWGKADIPFTSPCPELLPM